MADPFDISDIRSVPPADMPAPTKLDFSVAPPDPSAIWQGRPQPDAEGRSYGGASSEPGAEFFRDQVAGALESIATAPNVAPDFAARAAEASKAIRGEQQAARQLAAQQAEAEKQRQFQAGQPGREAAARVGEARELAPLVESQKRLEAQLNFQNQLALKQAEDEMIKARTNVSNLVPGITFADLEKSPQMRMQFLNRIGALSVISNSDNILTALKGVATLIDATNPDKKDKQMLMSAVIPVLKNLFGELPNLSQAWEVGPDGQVRLREPDTAYLGQAPPGWGAGLERQAIAPPTGNVPSPFDAMQPMLGP